LSGVATSSSLQASSMETVGIRFFQQFQKLVNGAEQVASGQSEVDWFGGFGVISVAQLQKKGIYNAGTNRHNSKLIQLVFLLSAICYRNKSD
jgi:hypothetical protein